MNESAEHVVIVGAGHGGGTAAALLRQFGHRARITLIGDEPIPPYQRPPLSKAWLKGEADANSLALRPLEFYGEQNIEFRPNLRAVGLERAQRTILLSDGSVQSYQKLIIATGSRAIELPVCGAGLSGVVYLRTAADADVLKARLAPPGTRLVVIGGGYIGLEVAAAGRALGAEVLVIERESRLLARVGCEVVSQFFKAYHERRGVKFQLGATVTRFDGHDGAVQRVRVADGRAFSCDVAVVGVGAVANDWLASISGLKTDRGIVVDGHSRSSDPHIFAIGDVAVRPVPLYGRSLRMESVQNVLEQAKQACCEIAGKAQPPAEVPWQWSDQYDVKLQIAGHAFDVDEQVLRGNPDTGQFSVFHLREGRVQSVEAVNSPADFMAGKQLILNRKPVSARRLADLAVPIRNVAA